MTMWLRVCVPIYLCISLLSPAASGQENALDKIRKELGVAQGKEKDVALFGKLELPKGDGPVTVRFTSDAYLEFSADAIVPNSLTELSRKDKQTEILQNKSAFQLGTADWFHLKLKHKATCTLHYKAIKVDMVLDRSVQKPFYIDTKAMKVVYLEKKKEKDVAILQISCDDESPDRTNKEVTFYKHHCCCCNENDVDCYGFVSCDDGWIDDNCF